mmetsp:Transcript_5616/g.15698  ORF Transcript_5616/g.15698 Transcript_5616/m.15698 type:complete len:255 (+) Transcript_5616:805-1569(+)
MRRGKSCIMHSRRVGFLKRLRSASAYLGFTNSGTTPCASPSHVALYEARRKTRLFALPGNGEKPVVGSFTSPSSGEMVARSSGSSWLYSTLMVSSSPLASFTSLVMAPAASPAVRGTQMEFMSRSSERETPSAGRMELSTSALVSWKKKSHSTPAASQSLSSPCLSSRWCTSPWPCGLVSTVYASAMASDALLSASAGTFSCFTMVSCSAGRPKLSFSASSARVRASVSSEVMMASGSATSPPRRFCSARMYST